MPLLPMRVVFVLLILLVLVVLGYMQLPRFGRLPKGKRRSRMRQSPQYRDGKFQNIEHTPDFTNGANLFTALRDFLKRNKNAYPPGPIPAVRNNLHQLDPLADVLVWFGHSSYFLQADGKRILVDPVMSGAASPIRSTARSFPGSDAYSVNDLPTIDYLLLTHDHWDHLDHATVLTLKDRVGTVITSLGVGAHLERWGFAPEAIQEMDWGETLSLSDGFTVHCTPARHFSGRGLKRAQTLWSSFVWITPAWRLFLGGDSGYGHHFKHIGQQFGPFDLAILECGQYNLSWQHVHMLPEETVMAAQDLGARQLLPLHWAKFKLSTHDWDEPVRRVTAAAAAQQQGVLTPRIGELLHLRNPMILDRWWEQVPGK
jgi:L-ascorbate metabolism protein UlaG (beta-lactamase superfamily)